MSAFLGPIHYWLYNKIGIQEELTKRIADYAEQHNWITDSKEYTYNLQPLETVIDEGNIHGWLQACISYAEQRYADLIKAILTVDPKRMEALKEIAFNYGRDNALAADATPNAAYEAFESFFVNGMPCDRVNIVTAESKTSLTWKQNSDIHAPHWTDTAPYYTLRSTVMKGMLCNTNLELTADNGEYTIKVK